jgi:hypothetical protein
MNDIDLESPGKLEASADNAKDYVFYIVKAKAWYNPRTFQANPNCVAGGDLFFKSDLLPDQGGKAEFDLAAKADELKHRMKDEGKIKVKFVTVTSAKATNEDPEARLAVVEPCTLKKTPPVIEITSDGDRRSFAVGKSLALKFVLKGMVEADVRCEPPEAFKFARTRLTKTEFLEITADKAIKGTIYCSGISIGGNKIEAKIDIEAEGPSLKIAGLGYTEKAPAAAVE